MNKIVHGEWRSGGGGVCVGGVCGDTVVQVEYVWEEFLEVEFVKARVCVGEFMEVESVWVSFWR